MFIVDRKEDMSPDGYLKLIQEEDGDIIVTVLSGKRNGGILGSASVQFCTRTGGGRSYRTREALQALMRAMARDNEELTRGENNLGKELLS